MNLEPTSCPYCNALIPPDDLTAGDRLRCPRCGERLPPDWAVAPSQTVISASSPVPSSDVFPASRNRKVAGIVLGLMACMAVVGLTLALSTWKLRESRHPKLIANPYVESKREPAELSALGYLPADTNLLAGIQVADLLKDKLGARLLEPPLTGILGSALDGIEKRTGITLDRIDHIVYGIALKDELPQLTIVLRTRKPYTREEIARLFVQKPLAQHQRPLFRLKLEPTGGGFLWCADPRTLVMVLRADAAKIEDMDRIPAEPRKGDNVLPTSVRDVLQKRLRNCVLWAAGSLEQTHFIDTLAVFSKLPATEVDLLKGLRVFGLGVLLQEDLTITGAFEARNIKSAVAWKDFLEKLPWTGAKSKKIVGPAAKGPESTWVNLQVRADAEVVRGLLDGGAMLRSRKD